MSSHARALPFKKRSFINNNPVSAQELNFETRQNMNKRLKPRSTKRLKPRSTSVKLLCFATDKNVHRLTWIFTISHGHINFNFHFLQQRFQNEFLTSSYPPSLELLVFIIVISDLCLVRHLFPFQILGLLWRLTHYRSMGIRHRLISFPAGPNEGTHSNASSGVHLYPLFFTLNKYLLCV